MTLRLREVALSLGEAEDRLPDRIAEQLGLAVSDIRSWTIVRKGIDARKKPHVLRVYTVDFEVAEPAAVLHDNKDNSRLLLAPVQPPLVETAPSDRCIPHVAVVGMGPAGLFCTLRMVEAGAQVTLIERGKPVADRLKDVRRFWNERHFDAESNVQFGEGGAGTFSDGKLTSRLNHPLMRRVLEQLVRFGAPEDILWQAKPHVGSDRLRQVLVNFRKHLLDSGVDIRFSTRLTGFQQHRGRINAVVLDDSEQLEIDELVLAPGHSARDTYRMLQDTGVALEQKPFAVGLRVEHPAELINNIQYGMPSHPQLPAAEYNLAWNNRSSGRGVYSFCMCPGGVVVNAASEAGGIVVNGMSDFKRAAKMSNSALVVAVRPEDFSASDPLAGVRFQRHWEQQAYAAGGSNWSAPAQPLLEFLSGSAGRLRSSVQPQATHADLRSCLPDFVVEELRLALPQFNRKMNGFVCADATLIGVETRTSAPLRILRNPDGESISHPGLYPAGEGAGYAGGIMSAAVDGLRVAQGILEKYAD